MKVTTGGSNSIWYNPNGGPGCVILPEKPGSGSSRNVTLSKKDRANAKDLYPALRKDDPERGKPVRLYSKNGVVRGPNGNPLVQVTLSFGKTAYVDPKTNKYFLAGMQPVFRLMPGAPMPIFANGPHALPAKARFSDANFSVADVRRLSQLANAHFDNVKGKDGFEIL